MVLKIIKLDVYISLFNRTQALKNLIQSNLSEIEKKKDFLNSLEILDSEMVNFKL